MVQVIKRSKVKGVVHETTMSFSDQEWAILQKHYPFGGVSFSKVSEGHSPITVGDEDHVDSVVGRQEGDDKPEMKNYLHQKDEAMRFFKEGSWDKAIYHFELAYGLKSYAWITGKITQCKKNALAEQGG